MKVEDVQLRLESIRGLAYDDERAHSLQDDLYEAVLEAIAGGSPDAAELARETLRVKGIEFRRWYG